MQVFCAGLALAPQRLFELRGLLSPDERQRADRLLSERHRARFAAARGLLRELLARELDVDPRQVRFDYGPHGKPVLAGSPDPALRFSVSHSDDRALFALARGCELGIDLERIRPDLEAEAIARRFFSAPELMTLLAQPAGQRANLFFRIWTRKEAYLKLRGEGLRVPLDSFDATGDEPLLVCGAAGGRGGEARVTLRTLAVPGPFAAALAVEGDADELQIRPID